MDDETEIADIVSKVSSEMKSALDEAAGHEDGLFLDPAIEQRRFWHLGKNPSVWPPIG